MKSEEKKSLTVRMTAIRLEKIKSLAKESGLSISDFIQMKCLDMEVEEEVVFVKKKKTLIEKKIFHCYRCDRDLPEQEKSSPDSSICYDCEVAMNNEEESEEEQPF